MNGKQRRRSIEAVAAIVLVLVFGAGMYWFSFGAKAFILPSDGPLPPFNCRLDKFYLDVRTGSVTSADLNEAYQIFYKGQHPSDCETAALGDTIHFTTIATKVILPLCKLHPAPARSGDVDCSGNLDSYDYTDLFTISRYALLNDPAYAIPAAAANVSGRGFDDDKSLFLNATDVGCRVDGGMSMAKLSTTTMRDKDAFWSTVLAEGGSSCTTPYVVTCNLGEVSQVLGVSCTDVYAANPPDCTTVSNDTAKVAFKSEKALTYTKYLRGDINGDGVVTPPDAQTALDYAVGNLQADARALCIDDMNGDKKISAADATLVLKKANSGQ